ncbi:MAG: 4'-phosphopantetheinyl transferase superfamily protein [Mucinivorans sp.]
MLLLTDSRGLFLSRSGTSLTDHRAVANSVASQQFASDISHRSSGAPFLTMSSQHLSVSHTDSYVALLASENPCGIDIELLNRNAAKVARRFTSLEETARVAHCFPCNPELLIWCTKEAIYKRCQRPDAELLHDFRVVDMEQNEIFTMAFGELVSAEYLIFNDLLIVFSR